MSHIGLTPILRQVQDDIAAPHDDIAAPHDDIAAPHDDIAAPHDDIVAHSDIVAPHDDIVAHSDIVAPHEDIVAHNDAVAEGPVILSLSKDGLEGSCVAPCVVGRAAFLRTAAAFAGAATVGGFSLQAVFAQSVESITPVHAQGGKFTYALPAKDGAQIDADNGVIVARLKSSVWAFSITCPHRAVQKLEWLSDEHEFYCPKHHAEFQPDGTLIKGRPDRSMDRFAIARAGQSITVDTGTIYQNDTQSDAWNHAVLQV